ncbi:MAG TPA: DUF5615 family PIN-like protein [Thermoanaerobaculia bacterium]|nr:DUF5615 family PIN-like protein [Thermoanaerobaculia bacterium]
MILLAVARQEPAVDFRSAAEAGLVALADKEVLAFAAEAGRVLVSHDLKTMPRHFGEFVQSSQSPGALLIPQRLPVPEAAEQLIMIWAASDPEEWVNRICVLPL